MFFYNTKFFLFEKLKLSLKKYFSGNETEKLKIAKIYPDPRGSFDDF